MDVQLGENIRRLREKRRITQKSLAFELEMDVSTLNRIENGITNSFKPQFFIKLTQHLDCSLDELFGLLPNEYMRKDKEMLYQELIKAKDTRIETLSTRIATLEKYIELPEEKQ